MQETESPPAQSTDDELLLTREAARLLRLCPRSLELWRAKGVGPDFIKIGTRTVRYRRSSLQEWLATREVELKK